MLIAVVSVIAQFGCIIAGLALGGIGTKVGGALLLASFAFWGVSVGFSVRDRLGGDR